MQAEEPYDSEEEAEVNPQAKRRRVITDALTVTLGLYCSGIGTLLSLFVPQTCGGTHCSLRQCACVEWASCSGLQQATLLLNFATCGVSCWALLWFWTREKWLVSHLRRDPHRSDRYLPKAMLTCVARGGGAALPCAALARTAMR